MATRRTRSQDNAFRALMPPTANEDARLLDSKPDFLLFETRAFGGDVKLTHSLVWVHSALADGRQRGRLHGKAMNVESADPNRAKTLQTHPHTTVEVEAFCTPNMVRTKDGRVYRVESVHEDGGEDGEQEFQLTDMIGRVHLSALWW